MALPFISVAAATLAAVGEERCDSRGAAETEPFIAEESRVKMFLWLIQHL